MKMQGKQGIILIQSYKMQFVGTLIKRVLKHLHYFLNSVL